MDRNAADGKDVPRATPLRALRILLGLALAGYGLLVVLRILAHDAMVAGIVSLVIGVALLVPGLPEVQVRRAPLVALLGVGAAGGVLLYNLFTGSGFGIPEWGLLLYGVALVVASSRLTSRVGRFEVGTLVGWSFPMLLAPLVLFSLNAVLAGPRGVQVGSIADPVIIYTLVKPMAVGLALFGTASEVIGNNIIIATPRGRLSLGVGLVCAGLYPMVLFLGVLGLHAWQTRLPRRLFWLYLAIGLVGLYIVNLVRLVALAKVGERWGGATLQTVHAHLGWLLFAVFMALFWLLVVRRVERGRKREDEAAPSDAA